MRHQFAGSKTESRAKERSRRRTKIMFTTDVLTITSAACYPDWPSFTDNRSHARRLVFQTQSAPENFASLRLFATFASSRATVLLWPWMAEFADANLPMSANGKKPR